MRAIQCFVHYLLTALLGSLLNLTAKKVAAYITCCKFAGVPA